MTCFGFTTCTAEMVEPPPIESSPPTTLPTKRTPAGATGLCAANYPELREICWTALECSSTNPCPDNKTCFENINCELTAVKEPSSVVPTPSTPSSSVDNKGLQNYCARNKAALETSCVTAATCNPGDQECPTGTFCFGDISCIGREEDNIAGGEGGTKEDDSVAINNDGIQQNYCAKNKADMETSCFSASTCNPGDDACPLGTYCFGDHLCGGMKPRAEPTSSPTSATTESISTSPPTPSSKNEPEPVTQQLLCASGMNELKSSCSTASDCSSGPCPSGQFCFPFDCDSGMVDEKPPSTSNQAQTENITPADCPAAFVGWHSSKDCKTYYECNNGSVGQISKCDDGFKFDKVQNECLDDFLVNSFCYGPAMNEGGAQQVTDQSPKEGNESSNREDPNVLCLEGYTGWETRLGCHEYYFCHDGQADVVSELRKGDLLCLLFVCVW